MHDPRGALRTAQVLIAECGHDMSRFRPSGISPPGPGSAPATTSPPDADARDAPGGPKWLTEALTGSAKPPPAPRAPTSPRTSTYFAAHFAQLRGRRGEPKAIGATRHDSLIAYYHIVRDQVPFRELGPDWLRRRYSPEHRARRLQQQLEALGYKVTLEQANPDQEVASAA